MVFGRSDLTAIKTQDINVLMKVSFHAALWGRRLFPSPNYNLSDKREKPCQLCLFLCDFEEVDGGPLQWLNDPREWGGASYISGPLQWLNDVDITA